MLNLGIPPRCAAIDVSVCLFERRPDRVITDSEETLQPCVEGKGYEFLDLPSGETPFDVFTELADSSSIDSCQSRELFHAHAVLAKDLVQIAGQFHVETMRMCGNTQWNIKCDMRCIGRRDTNSDSWRGQAFAQQAPHRARPEKKRDGSLSPCSPSINLRTM